MKYGGYLTAVSKAFDSAFDFIDANFGFDYGVEFEISLCRVLRSVLPARFGICRGFVVSEDGDTKGDDIIIYDRHNFPLLRMLEEGGYERKQKVPVDAVYAYLEAKHTLVIEGDGPSSLAHAEDQVKKVQLLDGVARDKQQMKYYRLGPNEVCIDRNSPPPGRSPMFGAIISRFVKIQKSDTKPASPEGIRDALKLGYGKLVDEQSPHIKREDLGFYSTDADDIGTQVDMVVAGRSNIMLPFELPQGTPRLASPYSIPGNTRLCHGVCRNMSFAMGVCSILWMLDTAHLGRMPWPILLAEAFTETRPGRLQEAMNADE